MRIVWFSLLIPLTLLAQDQIHYSISECQAFNNLKHTKNTHYVVLKKGRTYRVKQHHKGQYLIVIEGETPSQRWVDEACLSPKEGASATVGTTEKKQLQAVSSRNLLALSWQNAFCETHRHKPECQRSIKERFFYSKKRMDDKLTLHGLWPQPRSNIYCDVPRRWVIADKHGAWDKLPEPAITPLTKKALQEVMPGVVSNLHRHEWIKHGTCYGTDAEAYFQDAIALTQEVSRSKVGRYLQAHTGKRVTLKRIRELFDESFGRGAGSHVELRCQRGMISELWLHLGGTSHRLSELLHKGKKVYSRCQTGIVDRVGFQK